MDRLKAVLSESYPSYERLSPEMGDGSAGDFADVDVLLASAETLAPLVAAAEKSAAASRPAAQIIVIGAEEEIERLSSEDLPFFVDLVREADLPTLPFLIRRAEKLSGVRYQAASTRQLLLSCQREVALGRLLGSIAHEINNPLEAIANVLYLSQRSLEHPEKMQRYLAMAEEELHRVGDITKQLLQFHRDSVAPKDVDVSELLESVLTLYKNRLETRQVEVIRQFGAAPSIRAHPGELRQAFSNLIANAIDAMPKGGRLGVRVTATRPCLINVLIADEGQGISRGAMGKLGELMFTTKGEQGTGIGLWITYQLLKKYGASVRVYSSTREGRSGTAFRLCFREVPQVAPDDGEQDVLQMQLREIVENADRGGAEKNRKLRRA